LRTRACENLLNYLEFRATNLGPLSVHRLSPLTRLPQHSTAVQSPAAQARERFPHLTPRRERHGASRRLFSTPPRKHGTAVQHPGAAG
jgi:hypothetical protein